jgi:hypothetical protein
VEPKPTWNPSVGWPPSGVVWRVAPLPLAIELVAKNGTTAVQMCGMLQSRFDPTGDAPWVFIPGDGAGVSIWLVKPHADWLNPPQS